MSSSTTMLYVFIKYAVIDETSSTTMSKGFVVHLELSIVNTKAIIEKSTKGKESKKPWLSSFQGYAMSILVKNV